MILKILEIWDFRKFGHDELMADLDIGFIDGFNILFGENDSRKTSIIYAIKLVLQTQSNEFIRIDEEDFYCGLDGIFEKEFRIEITLEDFAGKEAKNLLNGYSFIRRHLIIKQ